MKFQVGELIKWRGKVTKVEASKDLPNAPHASPPTYGPIYYCTVTIGSTLRAYWIDEDQLESLISEDDQILFNATHPAD